MHLHALILQGYNWFRNTTWPKTGLVSHNDWTCVWTKWRGSWMYVCDNHNQYENNYYIQKGYYILFEMSQISVSCSDPDYECTPWLYCERDFDGYSCLSVPHGYGISPGIQYWPVLTRDAALSRVLVEITPNHAWLWCIDWSMPETIADLCESAPRYNKLTRRQTWPNIVPDWLWSVHRFCQPHLWGNTHVPKKCHRNAPEWYQLNLKHPVPTRITSHTQSGVTRIFCTLGRNWVLKLHNYSPYTI